MFQVNLSDTKHHVAMSEGSPVIEIEADDVVLNEKESLTTVLPTVVEDLKSVNKKLCDCVLGIKSCSYTEKKQRCSYAHSVDELNPDQCRYGDSCYRVRCTSSVDNGGTEDGHLFYVNRGQILCRLQHPGESFDNYLERLDYKRFEHVKIAKFSKDYDEKLDDVHYHYSKPDVERSPYEDDHYKDYKRTEREGYYTTRRDDRYVEKDYCVESPICRKRERSTESNARSYKKQKYDDEELEITVDSSFALDALALAIKKGKKKIIMKIT